MVLQRKELGVVELTAIFNHYFFVIPQDLIWFVIPTFKSFTFTAYLWIGAKDFFRGGM